MKALLLGLGAVALLWPFRRRERVVSGIESQIENDRRFRRQVLHGWLVVCAIAVAFVLYGLFAFFVVGDKGVPDWDFGNVPDVPGQSSYSTYPYRGRVPVPETQHVDEKPSRAEIGVSGGDQGTGPEKRPE